MTTIADTHAIFLRLYEHAIAHGERIGRITRLHRKLEQLGCPEDAIDTAYLRGRAMHECHVNAPSANA